MAGVLISGPAGANKSLAARQLLTEWRAAGRLGVQSDFQSIYLALSGDVRGPDGRYPLRDDRLLSLTEYLRTVLTRAADERGISVVATNSDGAPERRRALLERLGGDASERVIDPGETVVRNRLSHPITGEVSQACNAAVDRWYRRAP